MHVFSNCCYVVFIDMSLNPAVFNFVRSENVYQGPKIKNILVPQFVLDIYWSHESGCCSR